MDKKVETEIEVRNISVNDDRSRDWNSDEEFKDRYRYRTISRNSEYVEYFEENQNDNEVSISDEIEKIEVISVLANKNLQSDSENEEILISKKSASSQKSNRSPSRNSVNFETSKSSRCNSRNSSHKSVS